MKRIFSLFMILAMVCSLSLVCFATEGETTPLEVITTAPMEAETTPALTAPTEDEVEQEVEGWIDRIDESLSGVELWETAKAWLLANLSTVVGVIMAVITAVVGLATKFSFVPKIVNYVKTLGAAIGEWYDSNTKQVRTLVESFSALKLSLQDYIQNEIKPLVEQMEEQSRENTELRAERNQLYREYTEAKARSLRIETALLEYTKLSAQEFEDLIQTSDLTKAELDKHHASYQAKLALIEAASAEETPAEEDAAV